MLQADHPIEGMMHCATSGSTINSLKSCKSLYNKAVVLVLLTILYTNVQQHALAGTIRTLHQDNLNIYATTPAKSVCNTAQQHVECLKRRNKSDICTQTTLAATTEAWNNSQSPIPYRLSGVHGHGPQIIQEREQPPDLQEPQQH